MRVGQVPAIEQQPRTVADTATHYGYVAYKDIFVGDRRVQPPHSKYYKNIPARELIPFTNMDIAQPKEDFIAGLGYKLPEPKNGADPSVTFVQRTAKDSVEELASSYDIWGFKVLTPITGYSIEDAFEIFRTIQPFTYKLADILDELDGAEGRIKSRTPVTVSYNGDEYEFEPLRDELKETALRVLALVRESAEVAVNLAEEIKSNTTQKMEQFYATGTGKKTPDPLDKYVFEELNSEVPKLLGKNAPQVYGESAESLELKRKEIELREREIALREQEIAMKQRNADKMAAVRAAKKH